MKQFKFILTILGCTLILFACQNRTNKLANSLMTIQENLPKITSQFNEIQTLESNLQDDWEQELATNPTMDNYSIGEGAVFDNIAQRRELIAALKKEIHLLAHEQNTLTKNMSKSKPLADLQIINSTLISIIDDTNKYTTSYENDLSVEYTFFKTLTQSKLEYNALNEKIISMNNAAIERQKIITRLNEELISIDKPIRIAKARLTTK